MSAAADIPTLSRAARSLLRKRQAARAVESLAEFVRFLWPETEPGTELVDNWHIGVICDELEAVSRGECQELVICVPPGTLKSYLVSVMFPAWLWLHRPWERYLCISNSDRLCVRDSRRMRDIVQSERYEMCRSLTDEDSWDISAAQAEKVHFATTEGGYRLAIPTSARVTGDRGSILIIDDPVDAQESVVGSPEQVARRMEEVRDKYDHVWASRLNDPMRNPRITIMQRLAPGDLAGVLLDRDVRSVVLPMEFDPDHPYRHPKDPRRAKGELLFPGRFSRGYIEKLKSTPGASRHYQAQYQQNPPPLGGGVFRKEWFRYYTDEGDHYRLTLGLGNVRRVPKGDCWRVMVGDTALSEKALADYTAIGVWDVVGNDPKGKNGDSMLSMAILVDLWRGQATAPEVEDQIERMRQRYKPSYVALEDTTASKAIIDRLERPMPGERQGILIKRLRPRELGGDKVARAYAASMWMEAGRIFFPEGAPWLAEYESELLNFPGATHDDQVDMTAYSVILVADRNLWEKPKPEPLPPNAIGRILGHDRLLYQNDDSPDSQSAFTLNREREEGHYNSF